MAQQRRLDDPTLSLDGLGIDVGENDWMTKGTTPQQAPAPTGTFDLEGLRKRLGFGQVDLTDPQGWLAGNQDVAFGTKLVGDKLYGPDGKFLADIIGDSKTGGTKSQFLDGIDSNTGQKRPVQQKKPASSSMQATYSVPESTPYPTQAPATPGKGMPSMDEIGEQLRGLFPNGAYNQKLVNNRVSSASDALNANRKSRMATNDAILAERGLIGSGPELGAMNRMEEDLYNTFAGSVRDITGDESAKADQRMMLALTTAAGLSSDQAQLVLDRFKAENEDKYNMGNLALGNKRADQDFSLGQGNLDLGYGQLGLGYQNSNNSYNLGLGNLGLGQDQLALSAEQGNMDDLIALLQLYLGGAERTTDGAR